MVDFTKHLKKNQQPPKPPQKLDKELAVVAFDFNGKAVVIHCQGANIEDVIAEGGSDLSAFVSIAPDIELAGQIRVYEVNPIQDDEGISFDGGTWREVKGMEWAAIHTGAYIGTWKGAIAEGSRYKETLQRIVKKIDEPKEQDE